MTRAPVDNRHRHRLARAVDKIRRRLTAHQARPPALGRRNNLAITLPADCWQALLHELES